MDERAQSSVLSTVLIVGLVFTVGMAVALFGASVITDLSESAQSERASQEMSQLASESGAVALGESQRRETLVNARGGTLSVRENASWVRVENVSDSDPDGNVIFNETMGQVVYDADDRRVAYEGGGVWAASGGGSRMVSPPEFHYRGDTLTLPVVSVNGEVSRSGDRVELDLEAGETERVDDYGGNPLGESSGRVLVTVNSPYYEAWGRFLAERTDGRVVEYDHDAGQVTVELVVPAPVTVDHAVFTTGESSDSVSLGGAYVDSYDPTDGSATYAPGDSASDGSVATEGGIDEVEGQVDGDLYSIRRGDTIDIDEATINGDVHSQQAVDLDDSTVNGGVFADEDVVIDSEASGVTVDGDIHSDGTVDMDEVDVAGDVYANDGVTVDDDSAGVTVDGAVHAGADSTVDEGTFESAVFVDGALEADESTFQEAVHVDGAVTADGARFDGDLYTAGDLSLSGADGVDDVTGDVHVGGDASLDDVTVTGDLYVDGEITDCDGATVDGQVRAGDVADDCSFDNDGTPSVQSPDPAEAPEDTEPPEEPTLDPPRIDRPPEEETDPLPAECTEDGEGIVLDDSSDQCDLPNGTYDVSKLDIDDGDLTFEDGGVELYVGGDVNLQEDATVQSLPANKDDAADVEINVYDEDASVDIATDVVGVVNAPHSTVTVDSGAEIYGGIIGKQVDADDSVEIHYDESLADETVGAGQGDVPRLKFLHITRNELHIEG